MIHFNELYITEDGKNLVIDAEIDDFPAYKDCYLERITVDTTKHCEEPGLFKEPLVVWDAKVKPVGDLDGDGHFTKYDIGLYRRLIAMSSIWDVTATDHNKRIYVREDGSMYYNGLLIDEYGDEVYDESGDYAYGEVEVDEKLYSIYKYAVYHYDDPIQVGYKSTTQTQSGADRNTPILSNKFIPFIADQFTDLSIYSTIFGVENTSGIPADVNNDGEVNIADINTLINALKSYQVNIEEGVVEELITGQEQHVRLCLDASLLSPLINMKDSLSDHIFVVKVEAVMVDKTGDIAKMGCGWDNYIIYGAAYDGYPMYRNFLDLGESYSEDCDDSDADALSDFILTYYGFDFALRMGDWCTAWKYWNEMKGSTTGAGVMLGRGCGCHGAY